MSQDDGYRCHLKKTKEFQNYVVTCTENKLANRNQMCFFFELDFLLFSVLLLAFEIEKSREKTP